MLTKNLSQCFRSKSRAGLVDISSVSVLFEGLIFCTVVVRVCMGVGIYLGYVFFHIIFSSLYHLVTWVQNTVSEYLSA